MKAFFLLNSITVSYHLRISEFRTIIRSLALPQAHRQSVAAASTYLFWSQIR